jgi:hypothetical protein
MAALDHIANLLLGLLAAIAALVLSALTWLEAALGQLMSHAGIPPGAREIVAILIAVLFILAAFRLFGGLIRVVLIVVLVALLVHALAGHGLVVHPHATGQIH